MIDPASTDMNDPFVIGQLIGMLVILTYIENNNGINKEFLGQLKMVCAEKSADGLEQPVEDMFLIVEELVKNLK